MCGAFLNDPLHRPLAVSETVETLHVLHLDSGGRQSARALHWREGQPAGITNDGVRCSDKERDASGLYAYGHRYDAPWLGRWISPDPAGTVDGLNLFCMVRNNPVSLRGRFGLEDRLSLCASGNPE